MTAMVYVNNSLSKYPSYEIDFLPWEGPERFSY
jgi:hypothetical protein